MYSNLASSILSISNIEQAYIELSQKFFLENKSSKYRGIDDMVINDLVHNPAKVLQEVQEELLDLSAIRPVLKQYVPKKSGSLREVYSCSVKDRIKSQAIYRVIDPVFDKVLSPFLFSYRATHPSYYAARSVIRRYKRHYGQDFIVIRDVKDFADYVDHSILLEKFRAINIPEDVIEMFKLFMDVPVFGRNSDRKTVGLLQGIPLVSPFENLYLNDLDFVLGKKVSLYRRVGDDLIAFDPVKVKVDEVGFIIDAYFKSHGLISSRKKSRCVSSEDSFEFLGYSFSQGLVSISKDSLKKFKTSWRVKLLRLPNQRNYSLCHLKNILFFNERSILKEIHLLIREYSLADDLISAQKIDRFLWKQLTRYVMGTYSFRNYRQTRILLKRQGIIVPSYFKLLLKKRKAFG
ncbi:hypothetical protein KBG31_02035 [Patescibacteria group bacterium]|nr:hypothetical protein [Patescibacteria group bacterium]HOM77722.1 reverse transcriptase domain-containing protein [bacterium]